MQSKLRNPNSAIWRAALLSGDAAREALAEARAGLDLENLPPEIFPLLPKLYVNLCRWEVEDAWRPKLKGVYRQIWSGNQLRLPHLARAAEILGEPVLLPGAGWLVQHYGDAGLCAITVCDAWLAHAPDAAMMSALASAGWVRQDDEHEASAPAIHLRHPVGQVALCCHYWSWGDLITVNGAADAPLGGAWRRASPADVLLYLAGSSSNDIWQQWQARVALASGPVDWARLAASAREPTHAAQLLELLRLAQADAPSQTVAALRYCAAGGARAGWWARRRRAWAVLWQDYDGATSSRSDYLKRRWGLQHAGQLPAAWLRRVWRLR